uniref:Uncharacterized protein n=1 Tax=Parascaris equorum TaxID=6256 RepID=A0A914REF7_PAREQ
MTEESFLRQKVVQTIEHILFHNQVTAGLKELQHLNCVI